MRQRVEIQAIEPKINIGKKTSMYIFQIASGEKWQRIHFKWFFSFAFDMNLREIRFAALEFYFNIFFSAHFPHFHLFGEGFSLACSQISSLFAVCVPDR